MSDVKTVMFVGVGGQGTLLASRILGDVLIASGRDVKLSEVHGMSQRGGSVVTYVRYGERVASPICEKGGADIIVSFEQLEAARWVPYLKKGGLLITNTQKINPMPVVTGAAEYPEKVIEKLETADIRLIAADALSMAVEAGSVKCVNTVLLGILAGESGISRESFETALRSRVPAKFIEMNLRAFALGYGDK